MRAIAVAKLRANISPEAHVEIVVYPPKRSFFELVSESLSSTSRVGRAAC